MDPITNKLAAYIIDSGKHAEFSSTYPSVNDDFYVTPEGFNYIVHADTITFSAGIAISEEQGVELMISFAANKNFSSDMILHSAEKRKVFYEGVKSVSKTSAEIFRETYQGIFGFDCVSYPATVFTKHESINSSLFSDYSATRMRELLTEKTSDDSEINKAMHAAGFMFVAVRNVINGEPQPVFWANGHYTKNATDEDQEALEKIIVVCNSHLQTRYLNSLFSRARGFCSHLSV